MPRTLNPAPSVVNELTGKPVLPPTLLDCGPDSCALSLSFHSRGKAGVPDTKVKGVER